MNRFGIPSEDHQPITWLRGYPVYATHLIVLVYVVSMIITSILMGARVTSVETWVQFDHAAIFRGEVWRYLTYGLWNPPSIFPFAIDMLWLTLFGREVEKFFGRATFLRFYAILYLITPLLFTVLGFWWPMRLSGETGAFAVFVAFATLYPQAEMMFGVLAKWAAIILFGIFTLMGLAYHDYPGLMALWATVGFAHAFVRFQQGQFTLPTIRMPRRNPGLHVLPDEEPEQTPRLKSPKSDSMAEIDALLDKIAQSGMASLTAAERAKLDRARDDLKRKSSSR
jgi:hypothetical protein